MSLLPLDRDELNRGFENFRQQMPSQTDMESNPPVFGPPPFGQPPVFGPPGGQVPGGINYQNPFEFTDAINPYPDPLVGINPFPTIDPGANPFAPPTDDPYALPEQNPFPAIQPNPYLPPMPFQTPPINNTPFPDFAPVTFEPPPELPQGGFDPYQPVSGGPTTDPYGGTMYGGGSSNFDETTGQQPVSDPPPSGGGGGLTFFVGDTPFGSRDEAIDYARNVLGDPGAVEARTAPDPSAAQQPFNFATQDQLAEADGYFGVGDKRFLDSDEATRYARSIGTTGGAMIFGRIGDGELNVTGPQNQIDRSLTDAEQQARTAYRERSAREFAEQRRLNEQTKEHWSSLIDAQKQAQQSVNPNDFYYIDSGSLGELKFESFDQAKKFLESYNTAGREDVTDVYDKSQRPQMPSKMDRIKSSTGKSLFRTGSGADFNSSAFDNREDAIKFMMNRGEMSRDRAERLVLEYKADGGEISKRLNISHIKHFKRGGPVGTFVERR